MTRVDTILEEVEKLSDIERTELLRRLTANIDEARWGELGLHWFTEATRDEDWSEQYPESIRRLIQERKR